MRMIKQCKYMEIAYPTLDGDDTCSLHSHDNTHVPVVAYELSSIFQEELTTDETIAWFLDDAQAIVDEFESWVGSWDIRRSDLPVPSGCVMGLWVNGVEFVIQDSDWEPSHPELRNQYLKDRDLN